MLLVCKVDVGSLQFLGEFTCNQMCYKSTCGVNTNLQANSCKPDWSIGVDLCHHLLPPTDISKISHFPQGVVLHNVAHSEGGAGATLIEGFALFREGHRTCYSSDSDKVSVTLGPEGHLLWSLAW